MRARRLYLAGAATAALLGWTGVSSVAQEDVAPPAEVQGIVSCGGYFQDGHTSNVILGPVGEGSLVRRETRGSLSRIDVDEMNDPRLSGTWTVYQSWNEYVWPGVALEQGMSPAVFTSTMRIVDDLGAWQASDVSAYVPGVLEPSDSPAWEPLVLTGDGAYEGLIGAMWVRQRNVDCNCWAVEDPCTWDVRGFVLEDELPPLPEVPA